MIIIIQFLIFKIVYKTQFFILSDLNIQIKLLIYKKLNSFLFLNW